MGFEFHTPAVGRFMGIVRAWALHPWPMIRAQGITTPTRPWAGCALARWASAGGWGPTRPVGGGRRLRGAATIGGERCWTMPRQEV